MNVPDYIYVITANTANTAMSHRRKRKDAMPDSEMLALPKRRKVSNKMPSTTAGNRSNSRSYSRSGSFSGSYSGSSSGSGSRSQSSIEPPNYSPVQNAATPEEKLSSYDCLSRTYEALRASHNDFANDTEVKVGRLRRERNRLARENDQLARENQHLNNEVASTDQRLGDVCDERDDIFDDFKALRADYRLLQEKLANLRQNSGRGRTRGRGRGRGCGRGGR